jgi:hypothetical protein
MSLRCVDVTARVMSMSNWVCGEMKMLWMMKTK